MLPFSPLFLSFFPFLRGEIFIDSHVSSIYEKNIISETSKFKTRFTEATVSINIYLEAFIHRRLLQISLEVERPEAAKASIKNLFCEIASHHPYPAVAQIRETHIALASTAIGKRRSRVPPSPPPPFFFTVAQFDMQEIKSAFGTTLTFRERARLVNHLDKCAVAGDKSRGNF